MSVEFSKSAAENSNLIQIDQEISNSEWFQLGGKTGFPFPLKVQPPRYSISSSSKGSSSIYWAIDRNQKSHFIKVEQAADDHFAVEIFDNLNAKSGSCCFEQKSGSSVTIQSLTDIEAQRVHDAAKSAFVLTETVWHV